MGTITLIKFIYCFCVICFFSCGKANGSSGQAGRAIPITLGDPFIMLYEGVYYAYGTNHKDGIEVYSSDDLTKWSRVANGRMGLALHKDDVWADKFFWAPEVYYINGEFYMYYTADEHICVATSNSPTGPFVQDVKQPMFGSEKSIDNSLFIDDDGTPYLFFVRLNDGNNIWIAELEDDYKSIKSETMQHCFSLSQPWENKLGRVNEGPFINKHAGIYYMSYSANDYQSPFYGIGYATATTIMGAWTKSESNPILQKPKDLVGTGHHSNFVDKNGDLRVVFHSHNSDKMIHPRVMHISKIYFDHSHEEIAMKIDVNYITPTLKIKY